GSPIQVTQGGGFEAHESFDGTNLYFARERVGRGGLWSMPAGGGPEQPVPALAAAGFSRWAITQDGVCFWSWGESKAANAAPPFPILCWNSSTGTISQMGTIDKLVNVSMPSLSVSRNGKRFFWHQLDSFDAD